MTPGFTEFSYGFGLVENLIRGNAHALPGAPVFPNLVQEATLGYDVELTLPLAPLFLQFKLPEVMVRANAKEANARAFGHLQTPYYRMPVMRRDRSRQHGQLIAHEARYPGLVFYAMACIPNPSAFNSAFAAGDIPGESVFFSPSSMGPLHDDKEHKVIYKPWLRHAWFCSEPKEMAALQFNSLRESLHAGFDEKRFRDPRQAARRLRDDVIENVGIEFRETEQLIRQDFQKRVARRPDEIAFPSEEHNEVAENLVVAHRLARVGLGLELVVAQPKA